MIKRGVKLCTTEKRQVGLLETRPPYSVAFTNLRSELVFISAGVWEVFVRAKFANLHNK